MVRITNLQHSKCLSPTTLVNRNSSQENELWKAIADDIEKQYIEMSKSSSEEDRRIPMSIVLRSSVSMNTYTYIEKIISISCLDVVAVVGIQKAFFLLESHM